MSLEAAREHLDVATAQLERAQVDWWEPADPSSCVTNVFYAYENLVVAAAEAHDLPWKKDHFKKADLAHELYEKKTLTRDLRDEILRLNELRKDVSYGKPGAELGDEDLEGLLCELEKLRDEVEAIITRKGDAAEDE